jgi:all-trans-retinol dehydrogenase (NAD+)
MKTLKGKKAIVTGGAMGFGYHTCKRLLSEGVAVTIWDLNEEAMHEAKADLEKTGGTVYCHPCDVSDKDRVFELAKTACKEMGQVDILINNAGFTRVGYFTEIPLEQTLRVLEVNINALLYTTYCLLPAMLERNSGHIVNVGSIGSFSSSPGMIGYYTSKYAVLGMSDTLRLECKMKGKTGVHVTSVHPSIAGTGMFETAEKAKGMMAKLTPVIEHDDVAKLIVERGLKKNSPIVAVPRMMYMLRAFVGLIPVSWMDKFVLSNPIALQLFHLKGRPGMAHTDPLADKQP